MEPVPHVPMAMSLCSGTKARCVMHGRCTFENLACVSSIKSPIPWLNLLASSLALDNRPASPPTRSVRFHPTAKHAGPCAQETLNTQLMPSAETWKPPTPQKLPLLSMLLCSQLSVATNSALSSVASKPMLTTSGFPLYKNSSPPNKNGSPTDAAAESCHTNTTLSFPPSLSPLHTTAAYTSLSDPPRTTAITSFSCFIMATGTAGQSSERFELSNVGCVSSFVSYKLSQATILSTAESGSVALTVSTGVPSIPMDARSAPSESLAFGSDIEVPVSWMRSESIFVPVGVLPFSSVERVSRPSSTGGSGWEATCDSLTTSGCSEASASSFRTALSTNSLCSDFRLSPWDVPRSPPRSRCSWGGVSLTMGVSCTTSSSSSSSPCFDAHLVSFESSSMDSVLPSCVSNTTCACVGSTGTDIFGLLHVFGAWHVRFGRGAIYCVSLSFRFVPQQVSEAAVVHAGAHRTLHPHQFSHVHVLLLLRDPFPGLSVAQEGLRSPQHVVHRVAHPFRGWPMAHAAFPPDSPTCSPPPSQAPGSFFSRPREEWEEREFLLSRRGRGRSGRRGKSGSFFSRGREREEWEGEGGEGVPSLEGGRGRRGRSGSFFSRGEEKGGDESRLDVDVRRCHATLQGGRCATWTMACQAGANGRRIGPDPHVDVRPWTDPHRPSRQRHTRTRTDRRA
eukprot:scaffold1401_cov330-Pavlova_lutheri.AAC.59